MDTRETFTRNLKFICSAACEGGYQSAGEVTDSEEKILQYTGHLEAEVERLRGLVNIAKAFFTYQPDNTIEHIRREDSIRRWLARAEDV